MKGTKEEIKVLKDIVNDIKYGSSVQSDKCAVLTLEALINFIHEESDKN